MNHPKSRQIRLPFDVPRPNNSTAAEATTKVCGICRRNDSKYTCPRCNIVYCSLACFRDESHAQCSEPFYKSTVMEQIASDPKAAVEEKRNMIAMLRRFEEAQVDGEDVMKELEEEGEGDEDDELAEKLRDVDLDNLDSNALFHLLPQAHRDRFLEAIRNPESGITQQLLDAALQSEENEHGAGDEGEPSILPWWEGNGDGDQSKDDDDNTEESFRVVYADTPQAVERYQYEGIAPEGVGSKLAYNAIAICLAYVHTLLSFRLPCLSSDYMKVRNISEPETRDELGHLVPFLVDPRSTVRYTTVREAWSDVWDKIGEDSTKPPDQSLLLRLLKLIPKLIHPPIVLSSPPKVIPLISDLHSVFSANTPKPSIPVVKKLLFYLSALSQLNRQDWLKLEAEVEREIAKLEKEFHVDSSGSPLGGHVGTAHPSLQIVDT